MDTPENARLAAYQATRERLDFRRTSGQIKCKPPNRRCGDRCIPPSWDCRLKGEGNDPHLKAAGRGSDPIAGFANIERGWERLKKGAVKLSFSELEGGRRAIARGAAKLSPGDLKQKKELQERINQFAVYVGAPVAAIVFAGLAHRGLKAFPAYARGPGAQIDESVSNVFRSVARNMPITGQAVRAREAMGPLAIQANNRVFRAIQARSAENLSRSAAVRSTLRRNVNQQLEIPGGGTQLIASLNSADKLPGTNKRSNLPFDQWEQKSLTEFWSTQRTSKMTTVADIGEGSLFSVMAANDSLSNAYGIQRHQYTNAKNQSAVIINRVSQHLKDTGGAIRTTMREYGLNYKDEEAVRRFIEGTRTEKPLNDMYHNYQTSMLVNATISTDHYSQARSFYKDVVGGYDQFYKDVVADIQQAPSINLSDRSKEGRAAFQEKISNSYYNDAVQAHANYLANNIDLPARVYGNYTATLVKRAYHAKKVVGRARNNADVSISLTRTEVLNAASEVARSTGSPEPGNVDSALELLRQVYGSNNGSRLNGIGNIALVRGTSRTFSRRTPENTGAQRRARRRTRSRDEIINDLIKAGYSPEGAATEADRIIAARRRSDAYLLVRQDFTPTNMREGKPCGKSFIPKSQKCSKPTTARYAEAPQKAMGGAAMKPTPSVVAKRSNQGQNQAKPKQDKPGDLKEKIKNAATGAAALGGAALLLHAGASRARISAYRKNVAKSAVEAEKLSIEFERQYRDSAARRLKKRPEDVTGFEASVYNFKDKGQDRGFGSMDNDPAWYGQTKSSKGAVVMLSYADDNKFTTRGQGSHMMAKGGAFQQIWGDRDILPYANNISQPVDKAPDDLLVQKREAFVNKAEKMGGAVGKNAAKAGLTVKDTLKRFKFLRDNVDNRGFNPDAVRAAAFVAAQRRLTGKSVDIMSYSNGGNVATETLAILKEMGYRDVKVVNVAGPTFGIFSHSDDNMRTWVSEGDDFYKISRGLAFQGGNTRMLKNPNIPHGLTEKIDANNREFGKDAKANYKAKNSYLLDEQLQREAYKFLNVDRKRSGELLDETIWRISENKPMEGDLANLFGDQSEAKMAEFTARMNNARDREATKSQIRDEIEEQMLEKWYGGYNAKNVKKAQNKIQAELQQQINAAPRTAKRRPLSANQLATNLMKQNPGMSREAALKEARRRMVERKTDSAVYLDAYKLTRERHLTACA